MERRFICWLVGVCGVGVVVVVDTGHPSVRFVLIMR